MIVHACDNGDRARDASVRLLFSAIIIAGAVLLAAWIDTRGVWPLFAAGVIAGSALGGGLVLNRRAAVPGLPLFVAVIMAASVLIAAAGGGDGSATGGATVFVALMIANTARTRASALVATAILAAAQILAGVL